MITGEGFLRGGAAPNRVLIGDREAPLAAAIDDTQLEVVTPPGETAGDAPIVVFNQNGQGKATSVFRYSAGPTITSLTPADVVFNAASATVTITGTGFKDDDAGFTRVLVNGQAAVDVVVTSDTQLTFTAPQGVVLDRPEVKVSNARGEGSKAQGFRYTPSTNPTLLLFAKNSANVYAIFYDPATDTVATLPNKAAPIPAQGFRAVVQDQNGVFWGVDRTNRLGKIDLERQILVNPITLGNTRIWSLARIGNIIYALNDINQAFGTLNLANGTFTTIRTPGFNRAGAGIGSTGTNMHFANTSGGVSPLDVATGNRGAIVAMVPPATLVGDLRFIGSTMFTNLERANPGSLISINTANGTVSSVKSFSVSLSAIEVFPPGAPSTVTQ